MVGSRDSVAGPNVVLNTIVAEAFKEACDILEVADDFEMALHNRIKYNIRSCHRISGTNHTEFKFISRKCKRRSTVSVRCIFREIRKCTNTGLQLSAFNAPRSLSGIYKLLHYIF